LIKDGIRKSKGYLEVLGAFSWFLIQGYNPFIRRFQQSLI